MPNIRYFYVGLQSRESGDDIVDSGVALLKKSLDDCKKELKELKKHGSLSDDVEVQWLRKENEKVVFWEIERLFKQMQERLVRETDDREELLKQLRRLDECKRRASTTRGKKIAVISVATAAAAAVAAPVILVAGVADGAAVTGASACAAVAAIPVGVVIGTFCIAGAVFGLLAFGGMYAYAKLRDSWDRPKID